MFAFWAKTAVSVVETLYGVDLGIGPRYSMIIAVYALNLCMT